MQLKSYKEVKHIINICLEWWGQGLETFSRGTELKVGGGLHLSSEILTSKRKKNTEEKPLGSYLSLTLLLKNIAFMTWVWNYSNGWQQIFLSLLNIIIKSWQRKKKLLTLQCVLIYFDLQNVCLDIPEWIALLNVLIPHMEEVVREFVIVLKSYVIYLEVAVP